MSVQKNIYLYASQMYKYLAKNPPKYLKDDCIILQEELKLKLNLINNISLESKENIKIKKNIEKILNNNYDNKKNIEENKIIIEQNNKISDNNFIKEIKKEINFISNNEKDLPIEKIKEIDKIIDIVKEDKNKVEKLKNEKKILNEELNKNKKIITSYCNMTNGIIKELSTFDKYIKKFNLDKKNFMYQQFNQTELFKIKNFTFILLSRVDALDKLNNEIIEIKTTTTKKNMNVIWEPEQIQLYFYLYAFKKYNKGKIVKSCNETDELKIVEYNREDIVHICELFIIELKELIESWFV